MIGGEFAADAEPGEHGAAGPRVFTGDQVDGAKNGASPLSQVGEVADRRGDDVEVTGLRNQRSVVHRWRKEATRRDA